MTNTKTRKKYRIKKGLNMHNVLHDPVKNREYISREE